MTRAAPARSMFGVATATYLLTLGSQLALSVRANEGRFTYALDDAYIHLAVARNLARTGAFGIEPGVHASASSSPIWTMFLALFAGLGDARLAWVPLALNVLAAIGALALVSHEAARHAALGRARAWVPVAITLPIVLGLPALTLMGMEATAFLAASMAFLIVSADPTRRRAVALAALVTALRPEGMLLVAVVATHALAARKGGALRLVLAASAPVLLFGIYNLAHRDAFFANSMLMHGVRPRLAGEGTLSWLRHSTMHRLSHWTLLPRDAAVAAFVLAAAALLGLHHARDAARRDASSDACRRTSIFLLVTVLHEAIFRTGAPLARYQSYLLGLGTVTVLAHAELLATLRGPAAVAALATTLGFLPHLRMQLIVHRACHEIDAQQRQLAAFVRFAYPNDTIVANDIGAIAFERPGPLIDVCGLGSSDVRALTSAGTFDADALERIAKARNARIALVYPHWVPSHVQGPCGQRPLAWHPVAELRLDAKPIALGGEIVVIHAIGDDVEHVRERIRAFRARLPRDATLVELPSP